MAPNFDKMVQEFSAIFIVVCVLVTLLIRFILLQLGRPRDEGKVLVAPEFGCVATLVTFICVAAVGCGLIYGACK